MIGNRLAKLIEGLLWTAGIACVAVFAAVKVTSVQAQAAAITAFESAPPDKSLWSAQRIAAFERAQEILDPGVPIALLSIPSAKVRVAVFEGTSEHVLNIGAGRIPGTAQVNEPGNLAVAAHRDGFFRGLKDIAIGDAMTLETKQGPVSYTVSDISIVQPDDVWVLASTETTSITLVTCYPFYFVGSAPQRFIVRATLDAQETATQ